MAESIALLTGVVPLCVGRSLGKVIYLKLICPAMRHAVKTQKDKLLRPHPLSKIEQFNGA
jgi:hypothetical protein